MVMRFGFVSTSSGQSRLFQDQMNVKIATADDRRARQRHDDRPVDPAEAGAVDPGGLLEARGAARRRTA